MAQYNDSLKNQSGWIHDLAKAELHPEAEALLQLGKDLDPQQLVEESSLEFLTELKASFVDYLHTFNAYSESGQKFAELKIYGIAQTAADFMIFRNQIKLLVSNTAHGVISFSFSRHVRGGVSVDGRADSSHQDLGQPQDLVAQVGPFRDVYWTFQGEKVTAQQVARFYFSEFVRTSRVNQQSRQGNQLLLEEIKTLLKSKGLDF